MKYITKVRAFGAKFNKAQVALGAAMFVPFAAFAQGGGIDVSASVAEIGQAKIAAMALGSAALGVIIGIMIFKWGRRAL